VISVNEAPGYTFPANSSRTKGSSLKASKSAARALALSNLSDVFAAMHENISVLMPRVWEATCAAAAAAFDRSKCRWHRRRRRHRLGDRITPKIAIHEACCNYCEEYSQLSRGVARLLQVTAVLHLNLLPGGRDSSGVDRYVASFVFHLELPPRPVLVPLSIARVSAK